MYHILIVLVPFITAPYIARVIGTERVGIYSFTGSNQRYFSIFAALGTYSYGLREIARSRDSKEERSRLFWEIELLSVMTSAVSLLVWSGFIAFVAKQYRGIYIILTISILETMLATLDTILEFFALLIPITFLLMDSFGLYGVCAAVPVSELLTILIVEAVRKLQQQRGKLPREGLLMIPRPEHDDSLDATIAVGEDNAVGISQKIFEYAINRKADERTAQVLRLATEEMAVNISRYGYGRKENSFIDVNLSRDGETWLLRIRDDGIPFDPTKYKPEEECDYLIGGIALIRQMAKKITYTRVLNMNNTVIEV